MSQYSNALRAASSDVPTATAAMTDAFGGFARRLADSLKRSHARAELSRLSDRELADIGILRSQIEQAVSRVD